MTDAKLIAKIAETIDKGYADVKTCSEIAQDVLDVIANRLEIRKDRIENNLLEVKHLTKLERLQNHGAINQELGKHDLLTQLIKQMRKHNK